MGERHRMVHAVAGRLRVGRLRRRPSAPPRRRSESGHPGSRPGRVCPGTGVGRARGTGEGPGGSGADPRSARRSGPRASSRWCGTRPSPGPGPDRVPPSRPACRSARPARRRSRRIDAGPEDPRQVELDVGAIHNGIDHQPRLAGAPKDLVRVEVAVDSQTAVTGRQRGDEPFSLT
jgi:hypothetical protein